MLSFTCLVFFFMLLIEFRCFLLSVSIIWIVVADRLIQVFKRVIQKVVNTSQNRTRFQNSQLNMCRIPTICRGLFQCPKGSKSNVRLLVGRSQLPSPGYFLRSHYGFGPELNNERNEVKIFVPTRKLTVASQSRAERLNGCLQDIFVNRISKEKEENGQFTSRMLLVVMRVLWFLFLFFFFFLEAGCLIWFTMHGNTGSYPWSQAFLFFGHDGKLKIQ